MSHHCSGRSEIMALTLPFSKEVYHVSWDTGCTYEQQQLNNEKYVVKKDWKETDSEEKDEEPLCKEKHNSTGV